MLSFLVYGMVLGLSSGFAPGPLLTLVITETLQYNIKAGIKVAMAPIMTDLPIIIFTLFILSRLSNFNAVLGIISIFGGFMVLYLGYQSIRVKGVQIDLDDIQPQSLRKGIFVNALSPHPYLFWLSVGAPTMIKASKHGLMAAALFVLSFYFLLVASKITLAVVVGRSRAFLKGNIYIYIMRFLGFMLCLFACLLFHDGLKLLSQ